MRTGSITYSIICCVMLLSISCKKVTDTVDTVPKISFVSISHTSFKQFSDSIFLTFNYEDGDGDLGYENADLTSLEIKDTRLSKADLYYVQPLAPLNSKIRIKGKLVVSLRNLFLLGTGSMESTTLELRLKDRAGNWSNLIRTPELNIQK